MKKTATPNVVGREVNRIGDPWPVFGADPEFFVVTKKGTVVNSDRFFSSKDKPMYVRSTMDARRAKLFFDGIQAEFNPGWHTCREWVQDDLWWLMKRAHDVVGPNYDLSLQSCVKVRRDIIKKAHPEARIFGCKPDFCAYSGKKNEVTVDATTHRFRYAGGHIHIGTRVFTGNIPFMRSFQGARKAIRLLDIMIGIPLVLIDRDPTAHIRRFLYGKAGCFRRTSYGIEYRTPSSVWINSPELVSFAAGMVRLAYRVLRAGCEDYFFNLVDSDTVRYAIDNNDFFAAREIYKVLRPYLIEISQEKNDTFNKHGAKNSIYHGSKELNGAVLFEWLVANGIEEVFGKTLKERWNLHKRFEGHGGTAWGWFVGMPKRLRRKKGYLNFRKTWTIKNLEIF